MAAPVTSPYLQCLNDRARVYAPAASGYEINPGDQIAFFSGLAWPMSAWGSVIGWASGAVCQNASGAHATYLGVSLDLHHSTSVLSGAIAAVSDGEFGVNFISTSGTAVNPGLFVTVSQGTASGYLHPQYVELTSGGGLSNAGAIGKVSRITTPVASGNAHLTCHLLGFVTEGSFGNT